MSSWKTTVSKDLEKERRCRNLVPCLILVSVILLIYTVSSTIYIILQSQKVDSLERFIKGLSDRVDKMEMKLAAQAKQKSAEDAYLSRVGSNTSAKVSDTRVSATLS